MTKVLVGFLLASAAALVQAQQLSAEIDRLAAGVEPKVIAWRRDIHQHPELGNREVRTAKLVADHLQALGLEVRTGVAHTGVVAVLRGGKPGPVVALRADMDALPVTEEVDLPFASKVRTHVGRQGNRRDARLRPRHARRHPDGRGRDPGRSCKDQLPGTVKFIFQPAEEGPPPGEEGGAALMVKQGVMENPQPEAIFGLHIGRHPRGRADRLSSRRRRWPRPTCCASPCRAGRRTARRRGAAWIPIVVAAQIVLGLQTIVSRQINITKEPAVVTIGGIDGGNRFNIIPDKVEMVGTIRTFDETMRDDIHRRVKLTAEHIAAASGRKRRGCHREALRRHHQRSGAHGAHAADAQAGGRREQRDPARPSDGRRGFLLLRPEGARACSSSSAARPRAPT